ELVVCECFLTCQLCDSQPDATVERSWSSARTVKRLPERRPALRAAITASVCRAVPAPGALVSALATAGAADARRACRRAADRCQAGGRPRRTGASAGPRLAAASRRLARRATSPLTDRASLRTPVARAARPRR